MRNRFYLSLAVIALLYVVVGHSQGQATNQPPQKWEYKQVVHIVAGNKEFWIEDGKSISPPAGLTEFSKASELGGQGWELVSVAAVPQEGPGGTFVNNTLWFKRPK